MRPIAAPGRRPAAGADHRGQPLRGIWILRRGATPSPRAGCCWVRNPCGWTPTVATLWAWPWSRRPYPDGRGLGGRLHPAGGGRCGAPQRALRGGGLPCPSPAPWPPSPAPSRPKRLLGLLRKPVRALHTSGVQGLPIAIGQGWRGIPFDGLGIGACCNYAKERVPGCPPPAEDILRVLSARR